MSLKIYLDTSVISAYFDFRKPVRQLITQKWAQQNAKEFDLFVSTLVLEEIDRNTDWELREKMLNLLNSLSISVLEVNDEIFKLASIYREYIYRKKSTIRCISQLLDAMRLMQLFHGISDTLSI